MRTRRSISISIQSQDQGVCHYHRGAPGHPRPDTNTDQEEEQKLRNAAKKDLNKFEDDKSGGSEKKGLWNWKPIRALTHIGMQKLSCLFSVEVVAVQGLPASMNGLRFSVRARKKENKDGAVQTMPSRVQQGAADFEETLFIRCHVYYTPGSGTQMKFEPRPFFIYVFAVDAAELDFGKSCVDEETDSQNLDADEENVTREFLQMLEESESNELNLNHHEVPQLKLEDDDDEDSQAADAQVYIPDLGKGLGAVVQTRNGGYLAAMNPLDTLMARKDTPKLAMQISKPVVLASNVTNEFKLFQKMTGIGIEELSTGILYVMPIDELMGKTAEQIAFEGIASVVIQGRKKEGASSSAARTIASVKSMVTAMNTGKDFNRNLEFE